MADSSEAPSGQRPEKDRLFGPTLLLGLVGSGLLAIAGHRDWLTLGTTAQREGALAIFLDAHPGLAQAPVAGAMGLVALAAWGALLVTRGAVRRAASVLGVIASAGAVVAWFQARGEMRNSVVERADSYGFAGALDLDWTSWFFLALVGALLSLVASVTAVVRVPRWPAMGSRYDSPAGAGAGTGAAAAATASTQASAPLDPADADPTDLWKALDEGQDPT